VPPFAVLSCDNLPANGETTRGVIIEFAGLQGSGVADFIRQEVAFPATMVDRIVPATTDDDRAAVAAQTGFEDAWPVITEPFSQWVIEDRFPAGRPPFETAGVQFVPDVAPFELMKLRMLNGSHSTLAYLGYLAGHEYVAGAIAHPVFRALISDLMTDEVIPTLPQPRGELEAYRDALLVRFANSALKHRTWQIAMDGSQKLPQRLLGTIRDNLAEGRIARRALLGVAAWMRYVTGTDDRRKPIDVRDPLAAQLKALGDEAAGSPDAIVRRMVGLRDIFGDLGTHDALVAELVRSLSLLLHEGATASASKVVSGS
jgi:fructuronate reductase